MGAETLGPGMERFMQRQCHLTDQVAGKAVRRSQVASGFLHCVLRVPVHGAGANFFLV